MNFYGAARPLTNEDIWKAADLLEVKPAKIRAVMKVESRGRGFYKGRPIILFEPHVLYRELPASKRRQAQQEKIAHPKWRGIPYPSSQSSRYRQLEAAMRLSKAAALKSCSWGLAQIMGFNYKRCNYETVEQFVSAMCESEGLQLMAMCHFIKSNSKMHKAFKSGDWQTFAYYYNGSGYKKNAYDSKLKHWFGYYLNRSLAKKMEKIEREEEIKEAAPESKTKQVTKQVTKDVVEKVGPPSIFLILIEQLKEFSTELQGVAQYLPLAGKIAAGLMIGAVLFASYNLYKKMRAT